MLIIILVSFYRWSEYVRCMISLSSVLYIIHLISHFKLFFHVVFVLLIWKEDEFYHFLIVSLLLLLLFLILLPSLLSYLNICTMTITFFWQIPINTHKYIHTQHTYINRECLRACVASGRRRGTADEPGRATSCYEERIHNRSSRRCVGSVCHCGCVSVYARVSLWGVGV